jgi:aryl-alcohol dehydrogenase-like predicted oxidoreductase
MRYTRFVKAGIEVSRIALGGHEFLANGRSRGFNEDMAKAVTPDYFLPGFGGPKRLEILETAYDLGINVFDVTIDSEKEALGRNLREAPPPYPVYVQTRPEGMCYGYDPGNRKMLNYALLRAEIQRGLKLLRRDAVDLLNIGLLNWSIDETPDYLPRLADNLQRLRAEGLIRFAVADSFGGQRLYLAELASGAFDAVNLDLSIGEPGGLREVIPSARKLGLGVIVREVFFKGEIFTISEEFGVTDRPAVARTALAWVGMQGPDTIILGVDNAAQLRANAATLDAGEAALDRDLLAMLKASSGFKSYEETRLRTFFEVPESRDV